MEDLIGVLIFLVFAGLSLAGRVMKGQEQRKGSPPQWPGPTAQPPGRIPTPAAPRPQAPQPPRPAQPTFQRTQPPPKPVEDPWRSGSMPDVEDPEGPDQSERLSAGMERFARERDEMERHEIAGAAGFTRESEAFTQRSLGSLQGGLTQSQETTAVTADETGPDLELTRALTNPASFAQAVVLAEVLGKPKGLRRNRRV